MSSLLTTGAILATRDVIDPVFLDSPSMRYLALDDALGCAVTLKIETLNPIRSFKGRGTEAVLAALAPRPAAVVPHRAATSARAWHGPPGDGASPRPCLLRPTRIR